MKIQCKNCGNNDAIKFAPRKKGVICLECYETEVVLEAETPLEKAQANIAAHLSRPTGGNNRRWVNAYRAMIGRLSFLDSLPNKTPEQVQFMNGYREAVNLFNAESR